MRWLYRYALRHRWSFKIGSHEDASGSYEWRCVYFISKSRRLIKLLRYESDAYILYEKRLDRHRFMRPVYDEQKRCYRMNWERFVLLLQGIVRKELLIAS